MPGIAELGRACARVTVARLHGLHHRRINDSTRPPALPRTPRGAVSARGAIVMATRGIISATAAAAAGVAQRALCVCAGAHAPAEGARSQLSAGRRGICIGAGRADQLLGEKEGSCAGRPTAECGETDSPRHARAVSLINADKIPPGRLLPPPARHRTHTRTHALRIAAEQREQNADGIYRTAEQPSVQQRRAGENMMKNKRQRIG